MKTESKALATKLAECIHACNTCHDACLREKDVMMMTGCIRADKDCAAVCAATLQMIYAGSHLMKKALELCVEACETCARECSRHDAEHCRECARACRECAESCRDLMTGL